ncbi:MAG: hypothetical protein QOJ34_790, partial [Pseudonocardiales bacterium]|nr:hypothetical protein [Pseudonocardiales bacterium]
MRWPSLGRQRRRDDATATGSGAHGAPASSAAAPAAASDGAADRGWTSLPPISSTWSGGTPLTARPMTPAPPIVPGGARRGRATPAEGAPEPGRVIGLAAVVRPKPIAPTPDAELPAYFSSQPPLRHVTARPMTEHAPLMRATDAYVGEPVAPAPPAVVHAPQPSRSDPFDTSTEAGTRFREALANLHNSGLPRYVSPSESSEPAPPPQSPQPPQVSQGSWSRAEPPIPQQPSPYAPGRAMPSMPTGRPPGVPDDQPRLMHRRNSLAQSRRLGLGAPIRPDQPGGGDSQSAADNPDPEPAPASVTPPPPPPP